MRRIALLILFAFPLAIIQITGYSKHSAITSMDIPVQDDRVKIKKDELPEAARKLLSDDQFKSWSVVNIYKTKKGEYEAELKKGDTTQIVKFDKDGNKIA